MTLEKTASALTFESRSDDSSAFDSGRPKARRRSARQLSGRPEPLGSMAAGSSDDDAVARTARKYGEPGGLHPTHGDRPAVRPTFPGGMGDLDQDGPKVRRVVGAGTVDAEVDAGGLGMGERDTARSGRRTRGRRAGRATAAPWATKAIATSTSRRSASIGSSARGRTISPAVSMPSR